MNPLQRYNEARDREQAAFEASDLGEGCRNRLNGEMRGHVTDRHVDFVRSLAAEYAFGRRMPAFYAGRALRLW